MIRHVVLFRWVPDATDEQRQALEEELARLPGLIGVIRDYRFGPDARLFTGNCDFAVVADFDDADGYRIYRDHPAHRAMVENCISPILADRWAVQYEF